MTGSTNSWFKREKNAALVLIAIIVVFLLCQSIKIVPDIWEAFRNGQVLQKIKWKVFYAHLKAEKEVGKFKVLQ